jgi:hypothetical protein
VKSILPSRLPHLRALLAATVFAVAAAACLPGWAADAGPAWAGLSPAQRSTLAPLERNWSKMDSTVQQKWLEIAAKYPKMPPGERQRMQERMAAWSERSPQERGKARVNFQEARQVSAEERQARWQAYQALPEDRKRELAKRPPPAKDKRASQGDAKSNVVRAPSAQGTAKSVAPTIVQAAPGATTNLLSRQARPPAHQQAGLPKITASPGFVDARTLLPQRGAQGAATRSAAASAPAPRP